MSRNELIEILDDIKTLPDRVNSRGRGDDSALGQAVDFARPNIAMPIAEVTEAALDLIPGTQTVREKRRQKYNEDVLRYEASLRPLFPTFNFPLAPMQ